MMKKIICIVLVMLTCVFCNACKKEKKDVEFIGFDIGSNVKDGEVIHGEPIQENQPTAEVTPTVAPIVTPTNNPEGRGEHNIGGVCINIADKEVISMYGEPTKLDIQTWNEDNKKHQTWKYDSIGLEVNMVGEIEQQKVFMIIAQNTCKIPTNKGILIGSSIENIEKEYNTIIKEKTNEKIVASGNIDSIIFELQNNLVSKIIIGPTS